MLTTLLTGRAEVQDSREPFDLSSVGEVTNSQVLLASVPLHTLPLLLLAWLRPSKSPAWDGHQLPTCSFFLHLARRATSSKGRVRAIQAARTVVPPYRH